MSLASALRALVLLIGALLFVGPPALATPQVLNRALATDSLGQGQQQSLPMAPPRRSTWLHLRFDHARSGSGVQQALWLPSACGLLELRVNGVPLWLDEGAGGCRASQLLALPAELLRAQSNVLEMQLAAPPLAPFALPRPGWFAAPLVGSWDELLPGHQRLLWRQWGLAVGTAGFLTGLALLLTLLAFSHRWERRLILVSTCLMVWALLLLPGPGAGLDPMLRDALHGGLIGVSCAAWIMLLARHLGLRLRWADWVLAAMALLLPALPRLLAARLPIERSQGAVLLIWATLVGVCSLLFLQRRLMAAWRNRRDLAWADQLQYTLLPGLVSLALLSCLIPWGLQLPSPAASAVALCLALFALGLVQGFARMRMAAEQRARSTELRMHDRLAELERNHRVQSELHLEQVTERERKRIAADLHDDLGAKLLTIVHTSDSERISTLAREALEEMRLSVRGLTGKPVQLLDAVGDWRAEVVSRLNQANIEAEWVSLAEDVPHTLPARAYVQTTRVVREAISNIIKHSGATRCVVRCQVLEEGDFQVVIQDNGHGIPSALDGRLDKGHGMASMKARAKQMQGQCLVESGPGWGTLIRLTIPL